MVSRKLGRPQTSIAEAEKVILDTPLGTPLPDNQQDRFCILRAVGLTQKAAAMGAGYKVKSASAQASKLVAQPEIKARIKEVQANIDRELIMDFRERQIRLSENARARLIDFVDENGEPVLNRDVPNNGAAIEYQTSTRYTKDGDKVVTKRIKLLNPVDSISTLNTMDGIGKTEGPGITINNVTLKVVYDDSPKDRVHNNPAPPALEARVVHPEPGQA